MGEVMVVSSEMFTVEQELVLTADMHRLPVLPALKRLAGFDEDVPSEQLLLTEVIISAGRYGGDWKVFAMVGENTVGSIWCKPGTDRNDVLDIVDIWVRSSEHTTFVPGRVQEIPIPDQEAPYFVQGVVLVRGDEL